jgi:GNAT superfamily N-acetyltransferase
MTLRIEPLLPEHLDAVFSLFTTEYDKLPAGTLNRKTHQAFAELLSKPRAAHHAVFLDSALVGYCLCDIGPWSATPDPYALGDLLTPGEPVGIGLGMVIDPSVKGRGLGGRLLRARQAVLNELGIRHATGMVLTTNYSSIVSHFRAGGVMCGFDHDDYGLLNFAHYTGDLVDRPPEQPQIETSNLDEMRELFRRGYVGRRIAWDRTGASPRPVFTLTAEFANARQLPPGTSP